MKPRRILALALVSSLIAVVAHAHPGHDGHELTWDFSGGVLHPLSGWDHLLAMISVGVWAALLGGKARWLIPSAFVATMTAAAFAATQWGAHILAPNLIEQGIAASILGLGLLMALRVRLPLAAGVGLVAVFAAFHGWAHGLEVPMNANGISYGLGFVASTILLHAAGLALGAFAQKSPKVMTAAGMVVATAGLVAVLG